MHVLIKTALQRAWLLLVLGIEIQAQPAEAVPPPAPLPGVSLTNFQPRFQLAALPATNAPGATGGDVAPSSPARESLYEGLLLVQDKDYTNAIPKLEKAIKDEPSLLGAWEALGWSYWMLDRKGDAETIWERLLKLAPQSPVPYNLLSQVATYKKDLEKAEALLRKSLELDPTQFDTRLSLALTLAWQSKAEAAKELLLQIVKEEPDRLDVRIELAHVHYLLQEYEDASAQWKIVCEVVPDNPDFLIEWARTLMYSGDLDQAVLVAKRAVELDGGSLRALNVLADAAQIRNRPEEALPELRKLLDRTDDALTRSQIRTRIAALLRGLYDKDPKKFPLSGLIDECQESLREDPRNVNMMLFLSEVYIMNRRFDDAYDVLKKVREEINPNNYRAQRGLLEIYLEKKEFDKADKIIAEIYENPTADFPYRNIDMARLEFGKGNYHEAIRILDQMEREGMKGAVFTLLYNGLSVSDWEPGRPSRLFREHLLFLKRAGFKFISPMDIQPYFDSRKTVDAPVGLPAPYRFVQWIRYNFTGRSDLAGKTTDLESYRPDRVACVTFDGALRTSFRHGTPVAQELDIPMAMHIPVGSITRRDYGVCSWDEIKTYLGENVWSPGSHALDAGVQAPGFEDGYLVNPLPNRLWLKEKKRLESLREWSIRIRAELQDSRRTIVAKLGLDAEKDVRFVSYPFGDIGQMSRSNIQGTGKVADSIINEASQPYRIGFIQSLYGFSTIAQNPLALGRYEPANDETGDQVLKHAVDTHPVMMARRLKAELAALQGKPHLAFHMIDLLERDGYPAQSLRDLREDVDMKLSGRIDRADIDYGQGKGDSPIVLSSPYIAGDVLSTKANRQIDILEYGVRAGLHLSPPLLAEGAYKQGHIEQDVVSNRFMKTRETSFSETLVTVRGKDNGVPINRTERTTTISTTEVQTNVTETYHFESDYTYGGGRLNYRIKDGSALEGRFGIKSFDGSEEEDDNIPVWGATHFWRPAIGLDLVTSYDRDIVPSGRRVIDTDAVALNALWRARDWWEIAAYGRYTYFSETNAMLHLLGSTMWLVGEQQNIYAGFVYELTTMDEESEYYWSPYWEERYYFALRTSRNYPLFYASAEAKIGMARDKARPEDEEDWNALKVQGDAEGWYPGDEPGSDWEPSVGLGGSLRRMIGKHLEIEALASCSFYSEYSEYTLNASMLYHF